MIVVDVANVVGSRPDGWWRDRPGAAARFVARVRAAVAGSALVGPVVLVVEGGFRRGVDEGVSGGVEVVHAAGEGDDEIVAVVERSMSDGGDSVVVVTADRELRTRVGRPGAEVVGPNWILERLPEVESTLVGRAGWKPMRVIAIDGPAGSGKSTVARAVADRLGLEYLDTGAMYRAVAYAVLRNGGDPEDHEYVANLARGIEIDVRADGVFVDGVDASLEIRGPSVTRAVSVVAANPEVRAELVSQQREWAERRDGGVLEGRDIGTVVFPDAELKVYLTADVEERARRRAQEVTDLDYETVAAEIARRDAYDTSRESDPLAEADDAIAVDTTGLSIEQVVDRVVALL